MNFCGSISSGEFRFTMRAVSDECAGIGKCLPAREVPSVCTQLKVLAIVGDARVKQRRYVSSLLLAFPQDHGGPLDMNGPDIAVLPTIPSRNLRQG